MSRMLKDLVITLCLSRSLVSAPRYRELVPSVTLATILLLRRSESRVVRRVMGRPSSRVGSSGRAHRAIGLSTADRTLSWRPPGESVALARVSGKGVVSGLGTIPRKLKTTTSSEGFFDLGSCRFCSPMMAAALEAWAPKAISSIRDSPNQAPA